MTTTATPIPEDVTIEIEEVTFDKQRIGWEVEYVELVDEDEECEEGQEGEEPPQPEVKTGFVQGRYEVCERCRGKGTHTNPNIDGNGITQSEWAEWDYDERESYMKGDYDVRCEECHGEKVVAVIEWPTAEQEKAGVKPEPLAVALEDHFHAIEASKRESDSERQWEARMLYGSSY